MHTDTKQRIRMFHGAMMYAEKTSPVPFEAMAAYAFCVENGYCLGVIPGEIFVRDTLLPLVRMRQIKAIELPNNRQRYVLPLK